MEKNNKIILLILILIILGIILILGIINNTSHPVKEVLKSDPVSNFSSYINKFIN